MRAGHEAALLAVVTREANTQRILSCSPAAAAAGVRVGQSPSEAHAICAGLNTAAHDPQADEAFLGVLHRWARRLSPWVRAAPPDGLIVDLTGCAHLFGGEVALYRDVMADGARSGLTVRAGIADTLGAAWALARYGGQGARASRSGDAIDQEARATRSRSARRHWTRGGNPPPSRITAGATEAALPIAPPEQLYSTLSPLPVVALRLEPAQVEDLNRLGLRRIGDLLGQPRAALARRFGKGLVLRLDQAMGNAPEPVSPDPPPDHFAVRLTLPEPIGREDDVMAGVDRMLPRLCARLETAGRGVRHIRLEAYRTDQRRETVTVGLARPASTPGQIRPLIALKIDQIDAGFGIDMLRLVAEQTEPVHNRAKTGHLEAGQRVRARLASHTGLDDLVGRLGARVGLEAITRLHPAASHIPEKTAQVLAAAWSEPAVDWAPPSTERPLMLWRPEPVMAPEDPMVPAHFRWRGRDWALARATGPERIAPEWWLDDPDWRSGVRDYWTVTTRQGERLWLFFGHGASMSGGWFCQGRFA